MAGIRRSLRALDHPPIVNAAAPVTPILLFFRVLLEPRCLLKRQSANLPKTVDFSISKPYFSFAFARSQRLPLVFSHTSFFGGGIDCDYRCVPDRGLDQDRDLGAAWAQPLAER